jgi:hypothetical protein
MALRPTAILIACLIASVVFFWGRPAPAEDLVSGPAPGSKLTPVKVYAPLGPHAGKEFDAAEVLGGGPGLVLFVHELSRNTAPLIGGLDKLAEEYAPARFHSFTVALLADRTAAEKQLQHSSTALGLKNPMVLSLDGAEGPGSYALNRKCTLTVLTVKGGAVHTSFGLTDTGRQDLPRFRELIEAVTGPLRQVFAASLPEDPKALREKALDLALEVHRLRLELEELRADVERRSARDRMQPGREMRRDAAERGTDAASAGRRPAADADPKREGKPPEDPELESLLRQIIRKTKTAEEIDDLFARVEKRIEGDAGLRRQALDMFRLMLFYDHYGNDESRARAKKFVEAHAERPAEKPAPPEGAKKEL